MNWWQSLIVTVVQAVLAAGFGGFLAAWMVGSRTQKWIEQRERRTRWQRSSPNANQEFAEGHGIPSAEEPAPKLRADPASSPPTVQPNVPAADDTRPSPPTAPPRPTTPAPKPEPASTPTPPSPPTAPPRPTTSVRSQPIVDPVVVLAREAFGTGCTAFFSGDYESALQHFDNAISQVENDPRFRYFRGLALLRLGREVEAEQEFVIGAQLERTGTVNVGKSLERIQGKERLRIEEFRLRSRQ